MTLGEWLHQARARLVAAEVDAPALIAQLAAAHVLLKDRSWVLAHPEAAVPEHALASILQRLEQHEPLAYITGHREFFGLDFAVTPDVLIPRQETEILVEAAIGAAPHNGRVLDVGTGSGCVAIALKHSRPDLTVESVDLSEAALSVARRNAEKLGVEVTFRQMDGIEAMQGDYHLVVSNPPYIGQGEPMGPGVAAFEPHLALFAGPTGLEFYEKMAAVLQSPLLIEVGDTQAEAVSDLFRAAGHSVHRSFPDLLGISRVIEVQPSRPGNVRT